MSEAPATAAEARPAAETTDIVVVGAGFAGLYMLHRLRGLGVRAVVFEAGDDVGGTWYWNRYPGARVDVECVNYSFSFSSELEQHYPWGERYAPQPEILKYARHVADRFDLRRDIRFGARVTAARYDVPSKTWRVETSRGDDRDGLHGGRAGADDADPQPGEVDARVRPVVGEVGLALELVGAGDVRDLRGRQAAGRHHHVPR